MGGMGTSMLSSLGSMGGGGSSGGGGMMGGGGGGGMSGAASASGIGAATALTQTLQAINAKKKARGTAPEKIDPMQAAFLAEIAQKRKSIDTGAEFATGMQTVDDTMAATNNAIISNSGGDAAGSMQALLQSAALAGRQKNQVLAQGAQAQAQATGLYASVLDKIAQRKMDLQLEDFRQNKAEWAAKSKDAFQNWQGSIEQGSEAIRKYYGGQGDTDFSSVNANSNKSTYNSPQYEGKNVEGPPTQSQWEGDNKMNYKVDTSVLNRTGPPTQSEFEIQNPTDYYVK